MDFILSFWSHQSQGLLHDIKKAGAYCWVGEHCRARVQLMEFCYSVASHSMPQQRTMTLGRPSISQPWLHSVSTSVRQEQGDPWGDSGTGTGSVPYTLTSAKVQRIWFLFLLSWLNFFCFLFWVSGPAMQGERKRKRECALIIQMPNSQRKDSWDYQFNADLTSGPEHQGHVKQSYGQRPYGNPGIQQELVAKGPIACL